MTTFYAQPSYHYWHEFYIEQEQPVVVVPQHNQVEQLQHLSQFQQVPQYQHVAQFRHVRQQHQVELFKQEQHHQVQQHQHVAQFHQPPQQQHVAQFHQVPQQHQVEQFQHMAYHQGSPFQQFQQVPQQLTGFAVTPPSAINVQDLENKMYMEANMDLLIQIKALEKENMRLQSEKLANEKLANCKDMQIQMKKLEAIGSDANKLNRKKEEKLQAAIKHNERLRKDVMYLIDERTVLQEKLRIRKNTNKNVSTTTAKPTSVKTPLPAITLPLPRGVHIVTDLTDEVIAAGHKSGGLRRGKWKPILRLHL